ncbi:helix-turn-helix domain-containing protein [Microbacterium sp. 2P01SA-2]|uniref:TetR/AcrR family transcriptional regulator n=1 Tax=unclassified Microbacterium TaxID=2609290 RepID=UPI0039A10DD8
MAQRRLPARNEQLLAASMRAFAAHGYFGTTTAQVAEQMGVSQPYVIRTFGSKLELFIRTHAFAGELMLRAFRGIDADELTPERLGRAYRDLVLRETAAVLVHAHAFSASVGEPAIGVEARRLFDEVYRTLAGAGLDHTEMWMFMGRGMLINNLLLMEAPRYADGYDFAPLVAVVLAGPPPPPEARPDARPDDPDAHPEEHER